MEKHKVEGGLDLRHIENLNTTFVGKQAWRIHNNPQLLVSRIMTAKYKCSPIEKVRLVNNIPLASWGFRSMFTAAEWLKRGLRSYLGDGSTIEIEMDAWVQGLQVKKKIGADPTIRWVKELILVDQRWDASLVWRCFDASSAKRILSMHLRQGV